MTDDRAEALALEQDQIKVSLNSMRKNAHMYASGTEMFRTMQSLKARHNEIQKELDGAR